MASRWSFQGGRSFPGLYKTRKPSEELESLYPALPQQILIRLPGKYKVVALASTVSCEAAKDRLWRTGKEDYVVYAL